MATEADTSTEPAGGQLVCPMAACRGRRFFVYFVHGNVEVTCAECGARADDITSAKEVTL